MVAAGRREGRLKATIGERCAGARGLLREPRETGTAATWALMSDIVLRGSEWRSKRRRLKA